MIYPYILHTNNDISQLSCTYLTYRNLTLAQWNQYKEPVTECRYLHCKIETVMGLEISTLSERVYIVFALQIVRWRTKRFIYLNNFNSGQSESLISSTQIRQSLYSSHIWKYFKYKNLQYCLNILQLAFVIVLPTKNIVSESLSFDQLVCIWLNSCMSPSGYNKLTRLIKFVAKQCARLPDSKANWQSYEHFLL